MKMSAGMLPVAVLLVFFVSFASFAGVASAYSNVGMGLSEERVVRCPGSTETLELVLSNNDDVTHTYFLSLEMPQGWKIPDNGFIPYCPDCDPSGIMLASGEAQKVTFWINPPAVPPGTYDVKVKAKTGADEAYKSIEVEVLRCHDATIEAPPAIDICADSEFQYAFSVANNGKESEEFEIAASGSWGAQLYRENVKIDAGKKKDVSFNVASPQASGKITVTAASKSSYAKDEKSTQLTVEKCYDFQAGIEPKEASSCLGTASKIILSIKNTGTAADIYSIQAPGWVIFGPVNVTILPGGQRNVDLLANPGEKGRSQFDVIVTSHSYPKLNSSVTVSVEAKECKGVAVIVSPAKQEVCKGVQVGFNVTVKNTGMVSDSYELQSNIGVLGSNRVSLNAGEVKELTLNIDTKQTETGESLATVIARGANVTDQNSAQLAVKKCYSAELAVSPQASSVCPGDEINYTITAKNTGDYAENYTLSAENYTLSIEGENVGFIGLSLAPNELKTLSARLKTSGLGEGAHNLTLVLNSSYVYGEAVSSINVKPEGSCYNIEISSEGAMSTVDPGKGIAIAVKLKNKSEKPGNYTLGLQGPDWVHLSDGNVSLDAGEETSVYLYASPGYEIANGTYSAVMKARAENFESQGFAFRIGVGVMPEAGNASETNVPTGLITGLKGNSGKVLLLALIVLLILIILVVKFVLFVK
jgi:uncharacterized membrane protein